VTSYFGAYNVGMIPLLLSALWIAPIASGKADGSSVNDAAPLSALNNLITKAADTKQEVWIRGDLGVYNQTSSISINKGGVVVRGVDGYGRDCFAEFVGSRADPWKAGAANGNEMFRLNNGANNLTLRFLRFRNVGAGCIRMREPLMNVTVEDIEAFNVSRGVVNYGNGTADATVIGAVVRRVKIVNFSKHGIAFRHNSSGILVEDCDLDSQDVDGDRITVGFQLDDNASNGIARRVSVKNVYNAGPGSYYNGDGLSGEWGNKNWTFEDCSAENISDGGVDFKGDGFKLIRFKAKSCKRSVRLWGDALVVDLYSEGPKTRGDRNSTCHVFAMQGGRARVRIQGGTYIQSSTNPIFRVDDNSVIAWDAAAVAGIKAAAGYTLCQSESSDLTDSLSSEWNHNDTTLPTITSPLALSLDENKPGTFRITLSEIGNIQMQGLDASQCRVIGRNLTVFSQDYEKPGGVSKDGSNVLKIQLRVIDLNDNLSPWYNATITINDVADDPITPAQAIAASGATNGWWFDLTDPNSMWADAARTIPAIENGLVKSLADLTGFGNHCVFPDGFEPLLRYVNGYAGLEFSGAVVGNLGAKGALRYPQFTTVVAINRDRAADAGNFAIVFAGRRSLTVGTGDNAMYRLNFLDTGTATFKVNPNGGNTSSTTPATAPRGVPLVVSHRSVDGILRSGYDVNGMVQRFDGSNTATATYPLANEQPLLGAMLNDANEYVNFFEGTFYATMQLNATLSDDVRFRIERQLGKAAGLAL